MATLIGFEMFLKYTHRIAFLVLMEVREASSPIGITKIHAWLDICWLMSVG